MEDRRSYKDTGNTEDKAAPAAHRHTAELEAASAATASSSNKQKLQTKFRRSYSQEMEDAAAFVIPL